MTDDLDPWHCGYCGKAFVVRILARDCEAAHEADE